MNMFYEQTMNGGVPGNIGPPLPLPHPHPSQLASNAYFGYMPSQAPTQQPPPQTAKTAQTFSFSNRQNSQDFLNSSQTEKSWLNSSLNEKNWLNNSINLPSEQRYCLENF